MSVEGGRQRVLHLDVRSGRRYTIGEHMVPCRQDFEAMRWFLEAGRLDWEDDRPDS